MSEWTAEELSGVVDLSVRTIRYYTAEGLLPAPRREGRGAFYDERHRLRLNLVRTLQQRGFTLAAIGRVLDRIPADAPPEQYALQSAVLAPWVPGSEDSLIRSRAELDTLAGRRLNDDQLDLLAAVGAVQPAPGSDRTRARFRTDATAVRHVLDLLDLPVPTEVLTRSAALIDEHATAVAEGLTAIFAEQVWTPYQRGELDAEQVQAILTRLRLLAVQELVAAFTRAADTVVRRRLEPSEQNRPERNRPEQNRPEQSG